jgi:HlyD family secretion protein
MTEQNNRNGIAETLEIGMGGGSRPKWPRWAIVILLVVIAAAAAWYFQQRGQNSATTQYKTEPVRKGDLTVIVTATGTLKPTNSVDVGSELSGTV